MRIRRIALSFVATMIAGSWAGTAIADEAADADKVKPYPLETCIVSGEKLGSMGKPIVKQHDGQEVKFCCSGCVKPFEKDPQKYLKKMEESAAATSQPSDAAQ